MDGMAQPCGADIPDAEGSQHAHVGILQNALQMVKRAGLHVAMSETPHTIPWSLVGGFDLTLSFLQVRDREFLGAHAVGQSFHHFC